MSRKISLDHRPGRSPRADQKSLAPVLERLDQLLERLDQLYTKNPLITREEIERYAKGEDTNRTIETRPSAECQEAGDTYGCASIHGSKERDDGRENNEDCAFAVEFTTKKGDRWITTGVADGVSQSTWSPLGSRLASRVFLETTKIMAEKYVELPTADKKVDQEQWAQEFSKIFCHIWNTTLKEVVKILEEYDLKDGKNVYRFIPSNWKPESYNQLMNDPKQWGDPQNRRWFQTTIAGVAMGPKGGFGLFISDGVARVERQMPAGMPPSAPTEVSGAEAEKLMYPLNLSEVTLRVYFIARNGAGGISIIIATDGVSKTGGNALGSAPLLDSEGCQQYVKDLANATVGTPRSSSDNMSVAVLDHRFPV